MTKATLRQWHAYLGLFIGPSVLFFALTGAVQLYSLHESHGSYRPAAVVEKLSSLHKDQVYALGHHHAPPPQDAGKAPGATPPSAPPDAQEEETPALSVLLLKGFFLVVSLGLSISTLFGLWMGFTQLRRPRLAGVLVAAGTLLPLLLALA